MKYESTVCINLFLVLSIILLSIAGCQENPSESETEETGSIKVSIKTTGADQGPDGYEVNLNYTNLQTVEKNASLLFENVDAGMHEVRLNGVAENCNAGESNSQTVEVIAGEVSEVLFEIVCEQVVLANQIVFSRDNQAGIYAIDLNGDNEIRLTANGDSSPVISPDGMTVAIYSTTRDDENGEGNYEIYTVDASGYPVTRVTRTFSDVTNSKPTWSADGQKIAFMQSGDTSGFEDIVVVNGDGSGSISNLTGPNKSNDIRPSWSPDGSQIVFASDRDGSMSIFVMDQDGSNVTQLTDNSAYDDFPAWSPDGSQIAFMGIRDGNNEIFVMNADGTNVKRLTTDENDDSYPAWSPDGSEIVFQRRLNGQFDIFKMDAEGANLVNLTRTSNSNEKSPHWSPVQ